MPTVMRVSGYRLFFFSNEGSPLEPVHIHVRRGDALAKVWVDPTITVADSFGFHAGELREIERIIADNETVIRSKWSEHFGQ